MKKEMNPIVGVAIGAVAVIALCVTLYFVFLRQPTLDPKVLGASQAGMNRTQERLRAAGMGGQAGPPNIRSGAPSPGPQ